MKSHRNIGGSILPSNAPHILKPILCPFGQLRVVPDEEKDTHFLILTRDTRKWILASHPNGFSCWDLAERIVKGDRDKIKDQMEYIAECGGTSTSFKLFCGHFFP